MCWGGVSAYPFAITLPESTTKLAVSGFRLYALNAVKSPGTLECAADALEMPLGHEFQVVEPTETTLMRVTQNGRIRYKHAGQLKCTDLDGRPTIVSGNASAVDFDRGGECSAARSTPPANSSVGRAMARRP